ncbi:MAG: DUF58 domain-containing protein, partial [bacterium]|nr:DUF58 domain-containing protein [bacterium]
EYHSVFKGRGMEFSEVREYQYGDDVRTIDWNVSARANHPYVKVFEEERELTVMLVVDVSSSANFGTFEQMKGEIAVELCAVLAFSAIKNNDKVGLIIFSDKIEKFVPPKKGKYHVLRVLRELLYHKPEGVGTDINGALEYLNRLLRKKATVFLVSDFQSDRDYSKALQVTNKKHDIVAVTVIDPRELDMPDVGLIELEDAETGEILAIDTSDHQLMNTYAQYTDSQVQERQKLFKAMDIDHIDILTDRSYVEPLVKFFKKRAKQIH